MGKRRTSCVCLKVVKKYYNVNLQTIIFYEIKLYYNKSNRCYFESKENFLEYGHQNLGEEYSRI